MLSCHGSTADADTDGSEGEAGRNEGSSTVDRRGFVETLALVGVGGLAGCVGDEGEADGDDEDHEDDDDEVDVDPVLEVETTDATEVGETAATLTGELVSIEGVDEATLTFDYHPAEDEESETTVDAGTRDSPGSFEYDIDALVPDTEYQFRAVGQAEELTDVGTTESFTTEEAEPDYTVVVSGTSFDPDELTISVGETVEWVFEGGGHNVFVTEAPEESDWDGTEGHETFPVGHVHQHTFLVQGTYEYYCQPHSHLNMEGTVVVEA